MRRRPLRARLIVPVVLAAILCCLAGSMGLAVEPKGPVYLIPVKGAIDAGLARFLSRAFAEAKAARASAILVEIGTLGGGLDAALEIRDTILASDIPVIAFVKERAWSAGALVTIACHHIAMTSSSSMGAAEPSPTTPKNVSACRAELEATAERRGRDPRIAGAMVDAELEVEGVVEKGKLLTLTANQATRVGYADVIAETRQEVLEFFGLGSLTVQVVEPKKAEILARLVTHPVVAPFLLTLGMLGLVVEVTTPGWGVPGTVGVLCLALFFGGHMLAGLAGWEAVLLFVLGAALLVAEILVTPGFGVLGLLGIALVLFSVFLVSPDPVTALRTLSIAVVSSVGLSFVLARYVLKTAIWDRLVLAARLEGSGGGRAMREVRVGMTGKTLTPLRPTGIVTIGGQRVDVVSEGGFIPARTEVKVVEADGLKIVVRPVEE